MNYFWILVVTVAACLLVMGGLYGWFEFESPEEEVPLGYESAQPNLGSQEP